MARSLGFGRVKRDLMAAASRLLRELPNLHGATGSGRVIWWWPAGRNAAIQRKGAVRITNGPSLGRKRPKEGCENREQARRSRTAILKGATHKVQGRSLCAAKATMPKVWANAFLLPFQAQNIATNCLVRVSGSRSNMKKGRPSYGERPKSREETPKVGCSVDEISHRRCNAHMGLFAHRSKQGRGHSRFATVAVWSPSHIPPQSISSEHCNYSATKRSLHPHQELLSCLQQRTGLHAACCLWRTPWQTWRARLCGPTSASRCRSTTKAAPAASIPSRLRTEPRSVPSAATWPRPSLSTASSGRSSGGATGPVASPGWSIPSTGPRRSSWAARCGAP